MADKSNQTQHVSVRMPLRELSVIDTYAAANGVSRAQSMLHFIQAGISAETGERPATQSDLLAFAATITKAIESQPVVIQQQEPPKALEGPEGGNAAQEAARRLTWRERLSGRIG